MANRRTILQGALAALAGFGLARRGYAAGELEVTRLTDALAVIAGGGGNVVVHGGAEGKLLVDSGAAEHTEALLAALTALPGGERVHTLLNTHWHPEQVGGNAALGARGATIVAHAKTRQRLSAPYYLRDEDRYRPPLPPEAQPTSIFHTRGEMEAGGERIEYGYLLEAHTDGDIYVLFRDANVVAVGDAVSPERDPELDWYGGGWLGGRVDSLELLLAATNSETRFVPSYGPVVGRAEVQAERDLMQTLYERMREFIRQGDSDEDMLAAGVLDGLGRTFDDPEKLVRSAHKGLWAHHNTLSPDIV